MFEMIIANIAGFWIAFYLLLVLISLTWASRTDSFLIGSGVILVMWMVGEWVFQIPIFASIVANPLMLFVYLGLYIAIGTIYTLIWKLPDFLRKNKNQIQISYETWKDEITRDNDRIRKRELSQGIIPTEQEMQSIDVSYDKFLNSDSYKYSVKYNKDRVGSWVILWPVSIIWELSHRPFIWIWNKVYYGIGRVFERANHDMAKKILDEKNK
jgi:hypothetical protein